MDNAVISLQGVSKSFGRVHAVQHLSLEVPAGEIFGFLGPNGAGKSTTIRMLTGILKPDAGTITVGGINLEHDPVAVKRHVGYIPDEPYVYRYLTGREFLTFMGSVYSIPSRELRRRITEVRELFPTIDDIDAPFFTYSRGTRQKLVFMAALMHQPHVYVIDEPMVGLDPQSAKVVKDILTREVKERGATVFLSTHTLSVAEEICHRVGIINHGRLIAEGTLAELRERTHHTHAGLEELFLSLT